MSWLWNVIKQNPNLVFIAIKDNVQYTTLKGMIDEYKSLNSQSGLNCVRAYIYPELTYVYKTESDIRLIKTNRINRVFGQYILKSKSELCCDNKSPI